MKDHYENTVAAARDLEVNRVKLSLTVVVVK